jgi:WhiB family redox-sensing transcriptional regulator
MPAHLPTEVVLVVVPHRIGEAADPRLTGPARALPWADRALCAETDPELWFSERTPAYTTVDGDKTSTAKAICRRCPVAEPCLAYAMADPHLEGIWGGLTDRERARARGRSTA